MINATAQSNAMPQDGEFPVALVPRVNIHTFCDNQQTAETLQAAAMDRRMSKAHVTIQLGGILAAVQVYQTQPTPNVLVVEFAQLTGWYPGGAWATGSGLPADNQGYRGRPPE